MAGYAHDRGEDREIFRVGLRRRPIFHQEEGEPDRGESLERIDDEDRVAPAFSQHAQNIRGADVSASDGTNVDPGKTPREISSGKRPEKIADGAAGYDQGPHGILFAVRLAADRLA